MNEKKNDIHYGRFVSLGLVLALIILLFGIRLANLQISQHEHYSVLADRTSNVQTPITAARGEILDRNGVALAANEVVFTVRLDKNFLEDENATILQMVHLLTENNVPYNKSLPLLYNGGGFSFDSDDPDGVAKMKSILELQSYATVANVVDALRERYDLQEYTGEEFFILASVRYEMERKGFEVNNPYVLATDLPIEVVTLIKELSGRLPGVEIAEETARTYPMGSVAAHLLGRVTPLYKEDYELLKDQGYQMNDTIGRGGIESYMESTLKGTDGIQSILKDKYGNILEVTVSQEAVAGSSVQLTIDANIQKDTEEALKITMEGLRGTTDPSAEGAAAVVIDCNTGEILALANYPTYDMNEYSTSYGELAKDPLVPLYNRATQGLYAPGSTFKPCVGLAGLSEGLINRHTLWHCTGVYTYYEGYTPGCAAGAGTHTIVEALKFSCNTYFFDVGRRLGIDKIDQYAEELGLGTDTGIEIAEQQGALSHPDHTAELGGTWYPGNVIQAAIGQLDTQVTPLQLATYAMTLCNNGTRYASHLVKSVVSYDGKTVLEEIEPQVLAQSSASEEDFAGVRAGMEAVTDPGGTAYAAFVGLPFKVAAKTGTPQVTTTTYNGTFICYGGPDEEHQIAIAIVGEHISGGYQLAGIARTIFDSYLKSIGYTY